MPGLQLCCDPGGVLWPGPELQSGSVALAPAWRARRRTARTHVVLLLGRLGTDANTDLMEPPIAAAITLDPVHLVTESRETGFSGGEQARQDTGQATAPALGPRAQQPKRPSQSQSSSGDCSGAKTAPPCDKEAKGVAAASLPPS